MLTPQEPVKLHRIRNDQLYHYYLGDPIEVLMMLTDGTTQRHIVGPDLRAGQTPQLLHPGQHVSHRAGDRHRGNGFSAHRRNGRASSRQDVELGNADALAMKYPEVADQIRTWPLPAK